MAPTTLQRAGRFLSVRLTSTESDNKRLLKALVLACGLCGGLLFLAAVVQLPGAHLPEHTYRAVRISFLPVIPQDAVRPEAQPSGPKNAQSQPVLTAQTPPKLSFSSEALQQLNFDPIPTDVAVSGISPGEGTFWAANASTEENSVGSNSYPSGDPAAQSDSAAAGRVRFLAWLEPSIRKNLVYPKKARRRNLSGIVIVKITVSADGATCEASLVSGAGFSVLDQAALALVRSLFPSPVSPGKQFTDNIQIEYLLE